MRLARIVQVLCALALTASLWGCGAAESAPDSEQDELRVGTWNLEWFGALGRSAEDIERIASIIRELRIDVLALEEITCSCALEALVESLPGYNYFLSPQRIPQKLALLWNSRSVQRVDFDQEAFDALRPVAITGLDRELRQPLVFRVRAGRFDFTLAVVHLKSIPEAERSVLIRNEQYDALNAWLGRELGDAGLESDIIIAGDFNSYNSGVSSARLAQAGYVQFVTRAFGADEYSCIWYDRDGARQHSLIDHIAVSAPLLEGEFLRAEPIRDWDVELGADFFERSISDHLPLVAVFRADEDLDE